MTMEAGFFTLEKMFFIYLQVYRIIMDLNKFLK